MSENHRGNGVTVGFREIYDQMLGVSRSLERLDFRMKNIEEKFEQVNRVDERSRDALHAAQESLIISKRNEEKIRQLKMEMDQRAKERKKDLYWFIGTSLTIISIVVTILLKLYA